MASFDDCFLDEDQNVSEEVKDDAPKSSLGVADKDTSEDSFVMVNIRKSVTEVTQIKQYYKHF